MSQPPPAVKAHADLNAVLRRVIQRVRISQAPEDTVREVEALLARAEGLLAPHGHPGPYAQAGFGHTQLTQPGPGADPMEFFPYSPVIGVLNPVSPPLHFRVEEGEIRAQGVMEAAYNGPPGAVHGGMVALVLDELLGCVTVVNDRGGYTGTLTIRYLRPTPVGEPLEMRAWIDREEGRKTWARGEIQAGGVKTAEAEGIFIRPQLPPD